MKSPNAYLKLLPSEVSSEGKPKLTVHGPFVLLVWILGTLILKCLFLLTICVYPSNLVLIENVDH